MTTAAHSARFKVGDKVTCPGGMHKDHTIVAIESDISAGGYKTLYYKFDDGSQVGEENPFVGEMELIVEEKEVKVAEDKNFRIGDRVYYERVPGLGRYGPGIGVVVSTGSDFTDLRLEEDDQTWCFNTEELTRVEEPAESEYASRDNLPTEPGSIVESRYSGGGFYYLADGQQWHYVSIYSGIQSESYNHPDTMSDLGRVLRVGRGGEPED